jgi:hypothetical protein
MTQGYKAIFDENNISEFEAAEISREAKRANKAYNKFMNKQLKKPRHRYVKKMNKLNKLEEGE